MEGSDQGSCAAFSVIRGHGLDDPTLAPSANADRFSMFVPQSVAEVYVTDLLSARIAGPTDSVREKLAMGDIARQMANSPSQVLPRLVDLAMELCGAVAGGISIYEKTGEVFRWHHLRGTLENFTGATTPRDYSPCGITLDHRRPVLVQKPERVYSWLVDAGVSLPECLLVPLYVGEAEPLGTLWIVSEEMEHFNKSHASTMQELADFTGLVMQTLQAEDRLRAALEEQETLTHEMEHRVKNVFAIVDGMIRLSARQSDTKEELADAISGRLHALASASALVQRAVNRDGRLCHVSNLAELISAVLKPYAPASAMLKGPLVHMGEHTTNSVAMVFHELATNAAKYGAFSTEAGVVRVEWSINDTLLELAWNEAGGPGITCEPACCGFGTHLVLKTITRQGGRIANTWHRDGLQVKIELPLAGLTR